MAGSDHFCGHLPLTLTPSLLPALEPGKNKGRSPGTAGSRQFWVSGGNNGPQSFCHHLGASSLS